MTKATAGVLTGIILGAAHGVYSAAGDPQTTSLFTSILGRASQGIVNGILAAYVAGGRPSTLRPVFLSALIGAVLGFLSGFPEKSWLQTVPLGALLGACCGFAASKGR